MPISPSMQRLVRMLGALPDAVTALACIVVWVSPLTFGHDAVKTVVLMMLMEFVLVHGAGLFSAAALMDDASRIKRLGSMLALLAFHAMFIVAFAWIFEAWWPVWVFLWLVVGKMTWIFMAPRGGVGEEKRQMTAWVFSVVAYLGAVFASLMLPLPRLGITAELAATLGLPGSGEWVERPHIAVAGMAFYYLALMVFKYRSGVAPLAGVAIRG